MLINIYGVVINPFQYKWLTISSVIFCNVISMPCGAKPITHMAAMRSRPMAVMSSHLHQSADWSGTSFDPVCPLHDFLNRPIHLQPCFPSTSSREMQNIIFYYYMACLTWFSLVKKLPLNRTIDCCQLILKLLCKYASTWLKASCFSHDKIYMQNRLKQMNWPNCVLNKRYSILTLKTLRIFRHTYSFSIGYFCSMNRENILYMNHILIVTSWICYLLYHFSQNQSREHLDSIRMDYRESAFSIIAMLQDSDGLTWRYKETFVF